MRFLVPPPLNPKKISPFYVPPNMFFWEKKNYKNKIKQKQKFYSRHGPRLGFWGPFFF